MNLQAQQGLMTTYREAWRNRGAVAWAVSFGLIAFYCALYWEGELGTYLGMPPVLTWLANAIFLPDRWFLYGFLYTILMVAGAVYYLRRHGNAQYNRVRIAVNIFVQSVLSFTLPFVMHALGQKEYYVSYFWPLKWDAIFPHTLQSLPVYLAFYAVFGAFVLAPGLAIVFGKRWYCSWVCGCGALANTFGDPWRHLTSKSSASWRYEKVAIHSVLVLTLVFTAVVFAGQLLNFKSDAAYQFAETSKYWYGFFVGSLLAGVVGTGLYPLLGPRVWCRNFCPMAAMLGIFQKVGRFRIRVKPDMCISCGNCTTYCEMGIDVRSYAQSNQSFTRAACVGCGMCAHVCPRGVLKLEHWSPKAADKRRQGIDAVDF